MLYVPIKVYPNERSVRGCVVIAAIYLGLAIAGFLNIPYANWRFAAVLVCMVGFIVSVISSVAAAMRQPMLKVLDDRFSVYTPFGYVMIRFGEVLAFKKGGVPFMRTLRIDVNRSAHPRYPSQIARMLYAFAWWNFTNSVSIHAYMLGAQIGPVIKMLENRRQAAVRLDTIDDYDPNAITVAG